VPRIIAAGLLQRGKAINAWLQAVYGLAVAQETLDFSTHVLEGDGEEQKRSSSTSGRSCSPPSIISCPEDQRA
jgi:hypothetical protein